MAHMDKLSYNSEIKYARNSVPFYLKILKKDLKKYKFIYIMAIPMVIYYFIFHYMPMYGAQIAFKSFNTAAGIWNSPWVGFDNFMIVPQKARKYKQI